jgi:hypothetical protein
VTLLFAPNYVPDIGRVVDGAETARAGFYLGIAGLAAALLGMVLILVLLVRGRELWLSTAGGAAIWSLLGGALGIAFSVGYAMPWFASRIHANASDWTFSASGTRDLVWRSGSLTQSHGWELASAILLMALAALVPVLVGFWAPARLGAAALVGTGVALLAPPLHAVIYLSEPLTRKDAGMSIENATAAGAIFSHHGLAGMWMSLAAAASLLLLGFGRLLYSSARITAEASAARLDASFT